MPRPGLLHSLRTRLILWNAIVLSTLFAALGFALLAQTQASLLASVDEELKVRTQDRVSSGLVQPGPGRAARLPRDSAFVPALADAAGNILPNSARPALWDAEAYSRALRDGDLYTTVEVDGEMVRVASRRFPATGTPRGVIQAPYRVTDIYEGLAALRRYLLIVLLPIAVLGAALSGGWLTHRTLKPVRRITAMASEIEAQDLSRRLKVTGEDEFARLSETFNAMLDRLGASFAEQERLLEQLKLFTANASHDLQTPLSVIKANASLMLSVNPTLEESLTALQEIEQTADSMSTLVRDMLLLARADAGRLGRDRSQLSVDGVLKEVVGRASHRGSVPIELEVAEHGLTVHACEEELSRLLMNLIDNAHRYTLDGGRITVSARRDADRLVLTVADTGVGIAPEHLPHLGERFYRVDPSRARTEGGTGLGLSICRSIAEAYGGELTIRSSPGAGTTVTVSIVGCASAMGEVVT